MALSTFATQLEELMEELFSESATLYAEHGVELGEGIREMVRHVRARRLVAAGQVLKPIEKLVTRACLSQRDPQERQWLTTLRATLQGLRARSQQVSTTLREMDEQRVQKGRVSTPPPQRSSVAPSPSSAGPSSITAAAPDASELASLADAALAPAMPDGGSSSSASGLRSEASRATSTSSSGWRLAGESSGVRTDWRPADANDGSFWFRIDGEMKGAQLKHAIAVAYETDAWPKWLPLCTAAEVVHSPEPLERIVWLQFDLPMFKRGALVHFSLVDCLYERNSLVLLGHSVSESPAVQRPAAASGVPLAHLGAVKMLIEPKTRSSARIIWLMHLDLRTASLTQVRQAPAVYGYAELALLTHVIV